ncbi:uncharacterized protein [Oryza sativa Japonica Group]|uniref:uncharacterized protein isoform X1 n=1 Tax=Oryza sativa subsp. japonica TaxID=39947 RepID=UPI000E1C13AA|nr:uncharacterized protein LOC4331453 isoform X1 [Oryza sativa Japonica Group]
MKGGGGDRHHHKDAIVMHAAGKAPKCKASFFLCSLLLYFLLPVLALYVVALAVSPFYSGSSCPEESLASGDVAHLAAAGDAGNRRNDSSPPSDDAAPTGLGHIVFGIAASSELWKSRREYIRTWWRPEQMSGFVWLDKPVYEFYSRNASTGLPGIKISGNTTKFPYTHGRGSRSALRITRIVSESFRLGLPGARWFVMGDDDTVFFPDNLVDVLSRYDHTQPYYIGNPSESHIQNLIFSYGMAFGGGGFAISRALAAQLAHMQDGCIDRYPALYGSDDRIHACVAELGVPLTRHLGFHQCDLWGDVLGLLGAHPVVPLVTLHHLDFLQPVFPTTRSRTAALRRLFEGPARLDSAGVAQQSVCYDGDKQWTVSVSWGFAVVVTRGVLSPREMEMPMRTFLNWYRRADYTAYAFNTRPVARQPCQTPQVYYMRQSRLDRRRNTTVTEYERRRVAPVKCGWRIPDPAALLDRVIVLKKPDPNLWKRSPRRNCCRVLSSPRQGKDRKMTIDVGVCRGGEFARIEVAREAS